MLSKVLNMIGLPGKESGASKQKERKSSSLEDDGQLHFILNRKIVLQNDIKNICVWNDLLVCSSLSSTKVKLLDKEGNFIIGLTSADGSGVPRVIILNNLLCGGGIHGSLTVWEWNAQWNDLLRNKLRFSLNALKTDSPPTQEQTTKDDIVLKQSNNTTFQPSNETKSSETPLWDQPWNPSLTIQNAHTQKINRLCVWNRWLCSCSEDRGIHVYEILPNDFRLVGNLEGHAQGVFCMLPVSATQLWTGARDKNLCVWKGDALLNADSTTNYPVLIQPAKQTVTMGKVFSLALWNGHVVSGGAARRIQLWTVECELVCDFPDQGAAIWAMLEHKGRLWTAGRSMIHIWNWDRTLAQKIKNAHETWIRSLIFWDNKIWSSSDDSTVCCWKGA